MSSSFSRILDPSFEDWDDPFKHYDVSGEPLEDRLYLPCGIDPDKRELSVAFLHPFPQNNQVLEKRRIKNVNLKDASWLISTGKELAVSLRNTKPYARNQIPNRRRTESLWKSEKLEYRDIFCHKHPHHPVE